MSQHIYNLKKDKPDSRDWKFPQLALRLPVSVDHRYLMPPVYDQGNLGSCTANAIAAAFQYDQAKQKLSGFMPSRLFIYYNERLVEGTVNFDSGAYIRDGIKVINSYGVCQEPTWPYNINNFRTKPSNIAYSQALTHKALSYYRVNVDITSVKTALAAGFPVVIGFNVYSSFESATVSRTGLMPMPAPRELLLGGHATLVVGYNDVSRYLIVRNSWGSGWGDRGYFYMPYTYVTPNYMSDFWVINSIS